MSPAPTFVQNANIAQLAMDNATGWENCKDVVAEDATFVCQAGAMDGITTVKGYVDWCAGFASVCPNPKWDAHVVTYDEESKTAVYFCTYHATHTVSGAAGPPEPTNKTAHTHYVYVMKFNDDHKVTDMTKIWNDVPALQQLGWA